jgi:hypothetical protein
MKLLTNPPLVLIAMLMLISFISNAQVSTNKSTSENQNESKMKTFVIRRDIPDAGKLTADELKTISQTSCAVLKEMGPRIEWLHSYVTGNQIYCVYKAENENAIREHATKGGFPANEIIEVKNIISPETAALPAKPTAKKL